MLRNLVVVRIVVGLSSWFMPRLAGRLFGLDPDGNPQASYLARLFGVRDVVLGVGALQASGAAQKQWVQLGMACDVADAGAALLGRRDGSLPVATAVLVGGVAVAAAAMGAVAAGEIDETPGDGA